MFRLMCIFTLLLFSPAINLEAQLLPGQPENSKSVKMYINLNITGTSQALYQHHPATQVSENQKTAGLRFVGRKSEVHQR